MPFREDSNLTPSSAAFVSAELRTAGVAVEENNPIGSVPGALTVNVTWADTERGRGPVGTAIRTRRPSVFRHVATDPRFAPWRAEALRRGYAAVLGTPLQTTTDFLGALAIYASEPDAFDAEEVRLLEALANDLAYGVVALRNRIERFFNRAKNSRRVPHATTS